MLMSPALNSSQIVVVPLQAGVGPGIVVLLVLAVGIITVYSAIEIVNAYEKHALTVFGDYRKLLEPGINFVPPFVNNTYPFDMRTQTIDVPRQEAITRDNSPVTADAVVYIKVMDAKRRFWRSMTTSERPRTSPRPRFGPFLVTQLCTLDR